MTHEAGSTPREAVRRTWQPGPTWNAQARIPDRQSWRLDRCEFGTEMQFPKKEEKPLVAGERNDIMDI